MLLNRSLTLIGLTANALGAALVAKYDLMGSIKVCEESPGHLREKFIANSGWTLFVGGFCFQIVGLLLDA